MAKETPRAELGMHMIFRGSLLTIVAVLAAGAAQQTLELRGQLEPAPARATVSIAGLTGGFSASTSADASGRFRFRRLPPGPYIVMIFAPGAGMSRRSLDLSPSLADAKGRVTATIPFVPSSFSGRRPQRLRGTVSVSELAISDRARREFAEGQQRLRKQDVDGARSHLKKAVELAPQYMMAWYELGTIELRARNWTEAETCLRKALDLRPGALMPTLSLGGLLLNAGKAREALPYNRFAVERSPDNPTGNHQLGVNYFLLGQDEEALKYLRMAKKLDPSDFSGPQLTLADLYLRRGERAAAVAELEDYLARHPDTQDAPKIRGEIARLRR